MWRASARAAVAVTTVVVTATAGAGPAMGKWQSSASGSGSALAQTMPTAAAPAVSSSGRNATVSWSAATMSGGAAVSGRAVGRYSLAGALQSIAAGCAGVRTGTSCTEAAVPPGTWRYAVTPRHQEWVGGISPMTQVTIAGPALTLSGSTSLPAASLPAGLSGNISGFIDADVAEFRLDSVSGPVLTGTVAGSASPAAVPAGGAAAVTISIPAGTSAGSHTVFAVGSSGESASAGFTVTAPALDVTTSVIASSPNNGASRIRPGGTYAVVANVTGSPTSVTANVTSVGTAGQTAVPLTTCTQHCTIHGTTYGYRSAVLTANGGISGTLTYTVTATDSSATDSGTFSVVVDATAPTMSGLLQLNNVAPNAEQQVNPGDQIIVTYTENLAVNTLCSGWTNNAVSQNATALVTFTNGTTGQNTDKIFVDNGSCGTLNFGTIDMGAQGNLEDGNVTFSNSSVVWQPSNSTLTITLGTACTYQVNMCGRAKPNVNGVPRATATYTPAGAIQDLAGNAITGTVDSVQKKQF